MDKSGNPIEAEFMRYPNSDEQDLKRNEFGSRYRPDKDLREINLNDAEKLINITLIEITLDPNLNISSKEVTTTLGHELFGHGAFNVSNKALGYMWAKIEELIIPEHLGHSLNNPSGKQADKEGSYVKDSYRNANDEYNKIYK